MPLMSKRVALLIQYLGTGYCGWQKQPNGISIQQTIEEAIAKHAGHVVTLHGAGRTDTGVHASAQVAHFNTTSPIPCDRWSKILNASLPPSISILQSVQVADTWHAQFSAIWRRYRYVIYTGREPNVFWRQFTWHYYYAPLDVDLMRQALLPMVGEQDLSALQRAGSKRRHARLTVQEVRCWREEDLLMVEVQASGFLYGMMRLLMGLLVQVGRSQISLGQFADIWQNRRRDLVKYAAPPQGLCLIGVGYPDNPFTVRSRSFWG